METSTAAQVAPPSRGPALVSEIILCGLPVIMAVALTLRPDTLSDLGFQLKLGQLMAENGTPYLHEQFAVGHLGEPIVPSAWLAELFYHIVNEAGGWLALRALDIVVWLSALLVAALPAWKRGERPMAITMALAIGFAVALPTANIRPQNFAALAFSLMLLLLQKVRTGRQSVLLGAPLFVLWQNLHPSITLAAAVTGTAAVLYRACGRNPWPAAVLCLVAVASTFATPAKFAILEVAAYNTKASLLAGATEWLPLWHPINRPFLLATLLSASVAAIVAVKYRPPLVEVVPAVVTFVLTLLAARFILFYAIAIIPVLARLPIGQSSPFRHPSIALVCAAPLAIVLMVAPPRLVEMLPALPKLAPGSVIYADPLYGGELIQRGFKVAQDGRFYLYDEVELNRFQRTGTDPATLAETDAAYNPSAYVLMRLRSPALVRALEVNPHWREDFSDRSKVVFTRRNAGG